VDRVGRAEEDRVDGGGRAGEGGRGCVEQWVFARLVTHRLVGNQRRVGGERVCNK